MKNHIFIHMTLVLRQKFPIKIIQQTLPNNLFHIYHLISVTCVIIHESKRAVKCFFFTGGEIVNFRLKPRCSAQITEFCYIRDFLISGATAPYQPIFRSALLLLRSSHFYQKTQNHISISFPEIFPGHAIPFHISFAQSVPGPPLLPLPVFLRAAYGQP